MSGMRYLLVLAALTVSACEAEATDNRYSRIVKGVGRAEPRLAIPRGQYAARVCAGPDLPPPAVMGEPVALYPAQGVVSVTFDLPFVAEPPSGRRNCDLILKGSRLTATDGRGERFDYAACSILVTDANPQQIIVAPRLGPADGSDRHILAECIYRISLYVEGYRGALAEPSNSMFYDRTNSIHATKSWVGPTTTSIPWAIAMRCNNVSKIYYGTDLFAALQRHCPRAIELFAKE